jgi:hypothetical membrane protein
MKLYKVLTLAGIGSFIGIVSFLQWIQTDYSPVYQLMSELALGRYGWLMLIAFLSLAIAVFAAQQTLYSYQVTSSLIQNLLKIAALCLVGAGIFKLGESTTWHVALVTLAFILLIFSMYLLPKLVLDFQRPFFTAVCWLLGLSATIFIGLGTSIIPIGLAQRLSASCLLLWLIWLVVVKSTVRN